jgi:hypothetical protein
MTASSPPFSILVRGRHPDFVDLPWDVPLAEWDHPRLVRMAHGISRHVVRFVRYDDRVYALKATGREAAEKEYRTLRMLAEDHLPSVEAVGVVTLHPEGVARRDGDDDGWGDDGVLITRYLDFSLPYWYLLGRDEGPDITNRLIDAAVVLLVRLHLAGVYWGDCSLSNVLFRRDAGAMMAYLVDAETSEKRPSISDGLRQRELDIAWENIVGGLLDLQAAGRVPETVDPVEIADTLRDRYDLLWSELTREEEFEQTERWHIDQRLRHLNDLGFDVEELTIDPSVTGSNLRIRPVLVEEGHHSRELRRRTGLQVQENQARRLLADIANFRARRQQDTGREIAEGLAAALWMAEVFEPIVNAVPDELRTRLEAPELFHQLLEHRYLMSEREQREVTNPEALADYLAHVLPHRPAERNLADGSL